jgi:tetratricopeptide (TPR) repeat protein
LLHERAIRLSPRDPGIGSWYDRVGRMHLLQSHMNEAIGWLERALGANPAHPIIRVDLAAAYALQGRIDWAAAELAEARRLSRDGRYSSIARLRGVGISSGGYWEYRRSAPCWKPHISPGCARAGCWRSKAPPGIQPASRNVVGALASRSYREDGGAEARQQRQ